MTGRNEAGSLEASEHGCIKRHGYDAVTQPRCQFQPVVTSGIATKKSTAARNTLFPVDHSYVTHKYKMIKTTTKRGKPFTETQYNHKETKLDKYELINYSDCLLTLSETAVASL